MPRKYELKNRAERQEETHRRIIDAIVELHQEVGPARTTISAVAERAGVERLTVYRHFSDERELFQACSHRFLEMHPPPDPTGWLAIPDPAQRLRVALEALYAQYADGEAMMANIRRDAPRIPALQAVLAASAPHFDRVREILLAGWLPRDGSSELLAAAVDHAIDFATWQGLVRRQELTVDQAVDLMTRLVSGLAEPAG